MVEYFRATPSHAKQLLTEVRCNGDPAELAILLRKMTLGHRACSSSLILAWYFSWFNSFVIHQCADF